MSEDLYAKLDLTKKVRFQKSENKDKNTEVCDDTDNSASKDTSTIYDNYCVEGSTPPKLDDSTTEDQQQIVSVSVNSHERNLVKAAAVFLVLLCLFLLAAVIVMWIQNTSLLCEMKTLNISLTTERDQLQISYNKMQNNFTTLSREQEQLQKNYSRIQNLNTNLTQRTEQLEEEKQNLGVFNSNLTQQRDQLKQQLVNSVKISSGKKNLVRTAAVFLALLCVLLLVTIIELVILYGCINANLNVLKIANSNLTQQNIELQQQLGE
ncbi:hypothetical protein EXN66_Car003147 [Channa argus]|uniref:Uncharacterized protein n=1 Tax=Channa argus TaxID=215402 RepID=A0A6G1PB41_CHAAH|nr:hypothetical protein EXN66_Car003147 [Channa argus]